MELDEFESLTAIQSDKKHIPRYNLDTTPTDHDYFESKASLAANVEDCHIYTNLSDQVYIRNDLLQWLYMYVC